MVKSHSSHSKWINDSARGVVVSGRKQKRSQILGKTIRTMWLETLFEQFHTVSHWFHFRYNLFFDVQQNTSMTWALPWCFLCHNCIYIYYPVLLVIYYPLQKKNWKMANKMEVANHIRHAHCKPKSGLSSPWLAPERWWLASASEIWCKMEAEKWTNWGVQHPREVSYKMIDDDWKRDMGISENGGNPPNHPFLVGIFHEINQYKPSILGYLNGHGKPQIQQKTMEVLTRNYGDSTETWEQSGCSFWGQSLTQQLDLHHPIIH